MYDKIIVAFKKQLAVVFIVVGAIIFAIPIFLFGVIKIVWELGISFAARQVRPDSKEKLKHLLETIETSIGPQTRDKQTK